MPDAPIRVEVVLTDTDAAIANMVSPCPTPPTTEMRALAPDSLAARQIELAVAYDAFKGNTKPGFNGRMGKIIARRKLHDLLKVIRSHPDYRPANTGGG